MPNHFSAGMLYRQNSLTGAIEFLVICYEEAGRSKAWKFPGGTNRLSAEPLSLRNEEPTKTLSREWKSEVGQEILSVGNNPATFVVGRHNEHTQRFYLLDESDVSGDIRTEVLIEHEPGRKTETLGPPMWIPAEQLVTPGNEYSMSGNHHKALVMAIEAVHRRIAESIRNDPGKG